MRFKLVTTTVVGAFTYLVYLVVGGTVQQQTVWLADAGISAPTHVMTCPVRIDDDCRARIINAGVNVRKYERLSMPVWLRTRAGDAERDVVLPPMRMGQVRDCIEVVDWTDCTMTTAAAQPAIAALWGNQLPFSIAGVQRRCVRQKADAGLPCQRRRLDGGLFNFGNFNAFPRSEAADPSQCDPCECVTFMGDNAETDL